VLTDPIAIISLLAAEIYTTEIIARLLVKVKDTYGMCRECLEKYYPELLAKIVLNWQYSRSRYNVLTAAKFRHIAMSQGWSVLTDFVVMRSRNPDLEARG